MADPAVISRFAPAPTGYLHLGHVVNAIYVWGVTQAAGGRVLLRIEDHDRQRSRPEFERAILDDLEWLGFVPDALGFEAFRGGPCAGRQSDRVAVYENTLARLRTEGRLYACACSRRALARADGQSERRYAGTCRNKGLAEATGRGTRVRLDSSVETFDDLRHGKQAQCPAQQCGDLLVRDRDGNWTYQFAVVVDDLMQDVSVVIRGDDLLPSTGRQIQLARLLGRGVPPRFLHHPLIMKSATQKLSKADRDTSVRDLRASGLSPAQVIARAAFQVELVDSERPLAAADVRQLPPLVHLAQALTG
jgi:glutamyl/glutaminyl-tRNA synthetase